MSNNWESKGRTGSRYNIISRWVIAWRTQACSVLLLCPQNQLHCGAVCGGSWQWELCVCVCVCVCEREREREREREKQTQTQWAPLNMQYAPFSSGWLAKTESLENSWKEQWSRECNLLTSLDLPCGRAKTAVSTRIRWNTWFQKNWINQQNTEVGQV